MGNSRLPRIVEAEMRTFITAAIMAILGLSVPGIANADPATFNVSQFCSLNQDFPASFSSHGQCVNAWHKNDNTFFANACADPINQEFTLTSNQGQCMQFFKDLIRNR
jgi:hypothetical protein